MGDSYTVVDGKCIEAAGNAHMGDRSIVVDVKDVEAAGNMHMSDRSIVTGGEGVEAAGHELALFSQIFEIIDLYSGSTINRNAKISRNTRNLADPLKKGVEAAGHALALFPQIVEVIDWYSGGTINQDTRINRNVKISRNTRNLADSLKNQETIFRISVGSLLASIASEEDIRALKNDWGGPKWKEKALNDAVIKNLGEEADGILETANDIYKTLCELKKQLPVSIKLS
ncbi:hypothetical protein H2198_002278 [Neophaeococcomyces mojaviensis]|uniref:Uncharacterized protein n=1 Tax=Neophaeococcomyces mojaviensis TaxID=3383035 RepID=A0ACC3AF56_9EURO|nr:hypothetical protein H2198_002278 [Knufia sp. JES_112]